MCTLRGIWILKENVQTTDVLFSKRITTVETRVKMITGSNYQPIPNDNELLISFCNEILYPNLQKSNNNDTNNSSSSNSSSNNSNIKNQTPNTHVISLKRDKLWPFVYIKKKNIYYLTIPVIEEFLKTSIKPTLLDLPQITAALNFLEEISIYTSTFFTKPPPYPELQVYLANIIPFGQPIDTNFSNIKSIIRSGFPNTDTFQQKRPVWKPYLHKGKQSLDMVISESIQSIQYDNPNMTDMCRCQGQLYVKADLEGMPEISFYFNTPLNSPSQPTQSPVSLSNSSNSILSASSGSLSATSSQSSQQVPTISHLSIDSTVQLTSTSDISINNKISFNPPLEQFKLLSYGITGVKNIPIRGFYQMKEIPNNGVKVLIQLKLSSEMTNNFDYCIVRIPFKNRGNIVQVTSSPTTGTVHIDMNLRSLIWNIGQKFTGKSLEVALPADIYFTNSPQPIPPTLIVTGSGSSNSTTTQFPNQSWPITETSSDQEEDEKDPFFTGSNSFIKIFFKILGCTISGHNIDPKKVAIYPATKFKLAIEREVYSSDYIIWNSLGYAKYSFQPPTILTSNP